jgi:hypothetical protein
MGTLLGLDLDTVVETPLLGTFVRELCSFSQPFYPNLSGRSR